MTAQPFSNPLDSVSGPSTQWTRVNVGEAFPGVVTPLHYDFAVRAGELGIRGAYHERGVLTSEEAAEPDVADERVMAAFRGRLAVNVDAMRRFGDRVSNTAADDIELSLLGQVRPDAPRNPTTDRHAVIAQCEPAVRDNIERRALELSDKVAALWRTSTSPDALADVEGAPARWQEAYDEFREGAIVITHVTTFAGEAFGAVMQACGSVGKPELLARINGGYGDTHDDEMSEALWDLAHGSIGLADFLSEYGYQGHRAADLAATVWREDPRPLEPTTAALAALPDDAAPQVKSVERAHDRIAGERELLDALTGPERAAAAVAVADLRRFTGLRERVKAVSQRSLDIARGAARTVGTDLANRGLLDDREDVFYLLATEFITGTAPDLRERAAYRKALGDDYERVDIPVMFVGNPEPMPLEQQGAERAPAIHGLGVSPGVVEGRCRVIVDPATAAPLEAGEILVCHTTDPSWVGHFLLARALVIDVGGPMSHGAIVARELGVPCVINTGSATAQLRTGDEVRVDGSSGSVEVL
jgi:pyruvate,water dikinase